MRVLLHDYSGHPFQIQLSRELARRGNRVTHCYSRDFITPHGDLIRRSTDLAEFSVVSLSTGTRLPKHALVRRWIQERAYGRVLAKLIREESPDVVLSTNTPLGSQAFAQRAAREVGSRFVFWVQDLYGIGIDRALRARIPLASGLVGSHFIRAERRLLAASDGVVAISDDFVDYILKSGLNRHDVSVIENWGPLADFDAPDSEPSWKDRHGLAGKFLFLYAGTLGLKHNPALISSVARAFLAHPDVAVVVASEGTGAERLAAHKADEELSNLHLLGFQPYSELPAMLRSADVLMAVLERDASVYSVPSKVLTYMCAGRPILAAIPKENLAARVIARARAGIVVDPSDPGALIESAWALLKNAESRGRQGEAGLRYADARFRIRDIADRFEDVLRVAFASPAQRTREAV